MNGLCFEMFFLQTVSQSFTLTFDELFYVVQHKIRKK